MQILGLGKVIIMRFSGRKGEFEVFLSGSGPDARNKEKAKGRKLPQIFMFFCFLFAYVKKKQ